MLLQRYVLQQLLTAFGFAVGGLLLVLLPAILVNAVHKVGSAGLVALSGYLPLVLADLVPYILPLGFLLAVVSTFGRLAADREWTAVQMAGINPGKLLLPCLAVALLFGAGNNYVAATLAPNWKYKSRAYKVEVLTNSLKRFSPSQSEVRMPGFFLKAARRDLSDPGTFYEAHISVDSEDLWIYADRVRFAISGDDLVVELSKARVIKGSANLANESPTLRYPLSDLLESKTENRNRPKYLSSAEMKSRISDGDLSPAEVDNFTFEIHRRYALAGTYLLFLLLGVPTGIKLRSGTQLAAFAAAVAYALIYYVLSLQFCRQLFLSGAVPAAVAPWLTNILGIVIGVVFTVRVVRE